MITAGGAVGPGVPGEPFVSGPHLVHRVHPELATALGSLWVAVTRAGGAVGYAAAAPEDDIRAEADQASVDVNAGLERMLVIGSDQALAGVVFLRPGDRAMTAHRGEVLRLMVHPDHKGHGWGRALLDAAVALATTLGLEQLLLSTRGGTTLPRFYARLGWTQVGVWPGALRLADDDRRDEVWFQRRLG